MKINAVAKGHKTGFKSFTDKISAYTFLSENMSEETKKEHFEDIKQNNREESVQKKRKIECGEESESKRGKSIVVYTDGSCIDNGKVNAKGGVGVWFGADDKRNLSEKLTGKQTNQRAELMGPILALQILEKYQDVEIRTDSMYTINCVTNWSKRWVKNNWKTQNGKDVENQDLIKTLLGLMKNRSGITNYKHVRGHSGHYGNDKADLLAKAATSIRFVVIK